MSFTVHQLFKCHFPSLEKNLRSDNLRLCEHLSVPQQISLEWFEHSLVMLS